MHFDFSINCLVASNVSPSDSRASNCAIRKCFAHYVPSSPVNPSHICGAPAKSNSCAENQQRDSIFNCAHPVCADASVKETTRSEPHAKDNGAIDPLAVACWRSVKGGRNRCWQLVLFYYCGCTFLLLLDLCLLCARGSGFLSGWSI